MCADVRAHPFPRANSESHRASGLRTWLWTELAPVVRTPTLRGPTPSSERSPNATSSPTGVSPQAIELARERAKPIAQIAADIAISESCLRTWLHQADIDEGRRESLTTEERAEARPTTGPVTYDPVAATAHLARGARRTQV